MLHCDDDTLRSLALGIYALIPGRAYVPFALLFMIRGEPERAEVQEAVLYVYVYICICMFVGSVSKGIKSYAHALTLLGKRSSTD